MTVELLIGSVKRGVIAEAALAVYVGGTLTRENASSREMQPSLVEIGVRCLLDVLLEERVKIALAYVEMVAYFRNACYLGAVLVYVGNRAVYQLRRRRVFRPFASDDQVVDLQRQSGEDDSLRLTWKLCGVALGLFSRR